jgi:hypothetical protein
MALAFVRFAIPQALVFFVADHLGLHLRLDTGLRTPLQQVSDTVVHVTRPLMLADQQAAAFASPTAEHPERDFRGVRGNSTFCIPGKGVLNSVANARLEWRY